MKEQPYLKAIIAQIIRQNNKNPIMAFYNPGLADPLEEIAIHSDKLVDSSNFLKRDELQRTIASEIDSSTINSFGILSQAVNIKVQEQSKDTDMCYILPSKWENTIILVIEGYLGKVVIAVAGTQPELVNITLEFINVLSPSDRESDMIIVAQSKPEIIEVFQEMTKQKISNLKLKLAFDND